MVRVTPTQPHVRRSSYHFFPDVREGADPIFVRRTAARLPPQLRPNSREMAQVRDRFALANHLWSNFDSSQRAFYRGIALWITSDPRGRERETKLLSGQELFVALMMMVKALFIYLGLIPRRYEPFGGDLCGNPLEGLEIEIYSKTLKRTIGRWSADGTGAFQWISIPDWAAPFRICCTHPDLGQLCTQYETLDSLLSLDPHPVVHPVSIYTRETDRWTLAQDPTWCKKHCANEIYNQYDFEDIHEEGGPAVWNWQDSQLQVIPVGDHIYQVRWKAWMHTYHNTIYWKDVVLYEHGMTWHVLWSRWKRIDGRTGLEVEWP